MKVQTKASSGFSVYISKGKDHGTKVPPLTVTMLHEALKKAGVTEGRFGFQVIGFHSGISAENSKYFMSLSAPRERSLRINMKCGKSSKNTVKGVLTLSRDADIALFYPKLTEAVDVLNEEGWSSLWVREDYEEVLDDASGAVAQPANRQTSISVEQPRLVLVSNNESAAALSGVGSFIGSGNSSDQQQLSVSQASTPEKLTEYQKKLRRLLEERQLLNQQIFSLIKWRTREEIIAMLLE